MFYLAAGLSDSRVSVTAQNVTLTVDISVFLTVAILLSLVGLATVVMEAVGFLNEKAERENGMVTEP